MLLPRRVGQKPTQPFLTPLLTQNIVVLAFRMTFSFLEVLLPCQS